MVEDFDEKKLKTSFSELDFCKLDQFNRLALKSDFQNNPKIILKDVVEHISATLGQVPVNDQVLSKIIESERISKISDTTTNPDLQFLWKRPPNLSDSNKVKNVIFKKQSMNFTSFLEVLKL